jgi:hypothetical protein
MPYKSAAQRRFMHAQHPEIASRWDAEIREQKKKGKYRKPPERVKKSKEGWLKPLAIGVAGGALANQLPSFEQQQRLRENRRRRKERAKGVTKRLEAPVWPDDGFFNAKAAQEAYDLVMKMDADTAEMFVTCVVSDALEQDISKNLRTLQKHLDEVVAKQLTDLKRATMRVVSKQEGDAEEQVAFAQALSVLEEICKVKSPYDYGYVFQESKIRRDPGTGQFQTKVRRTQKKPINDKVAASMGIERHTAYGGKKAFTPEQKAQYQDEYRQLADFLGTVAQSGGNPGDTRVHLHFEDQHGNQWVERANSTRPEARLLDPREKSLRGVSAYPETLNVGGAAFGLAGAMGGGMSPLRAAQINAGAAGMPDFAENWTKDYGAQNTNARLYGRTGAAGKLLTDIAPAGSKANLAGHFGQFVGTYGPQAEAVIGPPARRTAYRYRGTEKKPDPAMVREYEVAVRRQMGNRDWSEEQERANKVAQNKAVRDRVNQLATERNQPVESIRLSEAERAEIMNAAGAGRVRTAANKPTWSEQNAAAAAIAEYLQRPHDQGGAAPRKGLYNLQLASGNTPPSEGVILNADGQIVTQAIGYGDDHYLPFNLKNLKGLKGGQYIRNRSVGGLTSEDIYTGLVSGARRVTVVSRSGTFTMEFEPDFRGGRRHNDKAARMTRRYEQLLDAVQSEQVERQSVDPDVRRAITQSVRQEADQLGRGVMSSAMIRDEVNRRIEDYKSSPDIDAETQEYIDLIVNNRTAGMTAPDSNKIRAQVMNQVAADKEYKFRLNGAGYADALESLREQFPYYIKVNSVPTKEEERIETEPDLGYVEPGKIRPTAAAAGLFGAKHQMPYSAAGKISAAQADFAGRFRRTEAPTPPTAGEPKEGEGEKKTEGAKPAPVVSVAEQAKFADAAVAMQQSLQRHVTLNDNDPDKKWLDMGPDAFRSALSNKDTVADFDAFVAKHGDTLSNTHKDMQPIRTAYLQASGRIGAKPYEAVLNQQWNPKPFAFEGRAYQSGASDADRFAEIKKIGAQMPGVVNPKPLDQMSDDELKQEVIAVGNIRRTLSGLTGEQANDWETRKSVFSNVNSDSPSLARVFKDEGSMDSYLETVHRTRAINQGIPDEQRGFKEQFHPPATEEANTAQPTVEKVENLAYLADQAKDHLEVNDPEYAQVANFALDLSMQKDRLNTPQALAAVIQQNPGTVDILTRLLHEGHIHNNQPEPERKALPGGPILT